MKAITVRAATMSLLALAGAVVSTPAGAVTYDIQNGKLVAIRGIYGNPRDVGFGITPNIFTNNGVTYNNLTDVEFGDGTCAGVFGVCNYVSPFSAAGRRVAIPLQSFLVDGVNIGGQIYNFSSNPSLINGCTDLNTCTILAGFSSGATGNVLGSNYIVRANGVDQFYNSDPTDFALDTTDFADRTIGRYVSYSLDITPTSAVPEPATWAMMIGGFGMVGGSMRRRKTRVAFA